jgi:hypothetical protein
MTLALSSRYEDLLIRRCQYLHPGRSDQSVTSAESPHVVRASPENREVVRFGGSQHGSRELNESILV